MINVGGYLEYRRGCSVPWGDILSTVGGYLEYRGGCSVPWGCHDACGGYHEYRGGGGGVDQECQMVYDILKP